MPKLVAFSAAIAASAWLIAPTFRAAVCVDAAVLVAKLVLFSAAIAASASAPVPVLYVPVTPVTGLVHSNVVLGPNANLLAANVSLNDVVLGPAAAFAATAAS